MINKWENKVFRTFHMKQFLVALFCLIIMGCNKQKVVITVELPDQPDVNLIYSVPIAGTSFLWFTDTIKQSETGTFELNLKIPQPLFITIFSEDAQLWHNNPQNRIKLLVEPGNKYHVSMDAHKHVQIKGANEKGQMLYATLPDPSYHVDQEIRKWLYNNDTVPFISVHHQINDLKQADLSKFKELLDDKEITKFYFDLIQKDRDCYYASLEARLLSIKSYASYPLGKNEDNLSDYLKDIYEQYPPNDESLLFSSFWPFYARQFVTEYKQFIQGDFDIQKLREFRNEGRYHKHIINESKKYLNGKALEFFQAGNIWIECYESVFKGSYDKEFVSLFEQFDKDYPKNEYSRYIKPYIEKIISYYQIIENPYDQEVLFLDNYETFNTLEEAIKPLLGKKIYIDVWATWCGPCKVEFAHNEELKKMLAENDIQQLYISIDRDDDDQQWKNEIKYHHLTGTHIRANGELGNDLRKLFNKENPGIAIPWYILIDENGNIIEEHAKSPSELVSGEKLF